MDNCIFCKIVEGKIPAYKVFENDDFMAFLDIQPHTKGHTLVIPKKHVRWVYEVPNFGEFWEAALEVTKKLSQQIKPQFISYLTYGLDVPHAHIHVIPRVTGGQEELVERLQITQEEIQQIAEKINR